MGWYLLSPTEEANVLLDVLGNETRRKILQLLATEPMYLMRLAEELRVSQQAVLKHLAILERYRIVTSYTAPGEMPGPLRKYYRLSKSVCLSFEMTPDSVDFEMRTIPSAEAEGAEIPKADFGREGVLGAFGDVLKKLERDVAALEEEGDSKRTLEKCNEVLKELNRRLDELEGFRVGLLALKQAAVNRAHSAIRRLAEEELERRILYWSLGSDERLDVEELSDLLDVREREIRSAVAQLQKKFLL